MVLNFKKNLWMTTTHQWGFSRSQGAKGANVQSDTMVYGYKKGWLFIRKRKKNIIKKNIKKVLF
jgi:hypothetical protein